MGLSVKFDGVELNRFIHVLSGFTPFTGANWDVSVSNDGAKRGADYNYTTYKSKTITMPFDISGGLEENYNQLCKALNVDEPKELVFGSIPDKVFYAIPKGNLDFEQIAFLGNGVITWLIPDGLAHSTVEKVFSAKLNADGILEARIVNEGTEAVPVSYEIVHNHENGYIGIVSEYGVIQYGQVNERDEEIKQKSEMLIDYQSGGEIYGGLTKGGVFISPYLNTSPFRVHEIDGVEYLEIDRFNVGGGNYWHGAGGYVKFPKDANGHAGAKNWKASAKIWFQGTAARQYGDIDFCISKGNEIIASFQIWDGYMGTYQTYVEMYVGRVKKGKHTYNADASGWSNRNDGKIYIQKSGELFTFGFGPHRYQFREPSMRDVEADQVNIFLALAPGDGYWQMTWACVEKLGVRTDSVDYNFDIPNRYPAGTVVGIDGETGRIFVDGIPHQEDEIMGSRYFKVPPGETVVQFAYSDFCTPPPTVKAWIREAYL